MPPAKASARDSILTTAMFLIPLILALGIAPDAYGDLMFFRAFGEREVTGKDTSQYNLVVLPPDSPTGGLQFYYVERTPELRIRLEEIESVVAERTQYDPDMTKLMEDVLRRRGKGEQLIDDPDDLTVTFSLTEGGGKRFRSFAQRHDRETFDIRFNAERVSIGRLIGPFGGNVVSAFVRKETVDRLKKAFPRLKIR